MDAPPFDRRGRACSDFADVSVSLMPNENSLFGRIISLFRPKFSLFDCVGNSIKKGNHYGWLGRRIRAKNARIAKIPCIFPGYQGIAGE